MRTVVPYRHPWWLPVAVITGVGYAVALGGCAVALGYPVGPTGATDTAGAGVRGAGAAVTAGVAALTWSSGIRSPALLLAGLFGLSVAAELVSDSSQVVVAGERFTSGTPWLAGYTAAWPALVLVVAGTAAAEWRVRRGRVADPNDNGQSAAGFRPAWGSVLRWSLAAGGLAAAAIVVVPGFVGAVPAPLLVWGVTGHALGFAVTGLLLARPGLVTPVALLLLGLLMVAVEARVVTLGAPAGTYLALWPGYLVIALVAGGLEAAARRVTRRLQSSGGRGADTGVANG